MRHCLFLLMLVVAQTAAIGAHAKLRYFKVDGILYHVLSGKDQEVEVLLANYEGDIVIPATVCQGDETYTVTQIGEEAFKTTSGNPGVSSVKLPETIVNICDEAFRDARLLTEIALPESLETIGQYAFYGCSGLQSISIPSQVKVISDYAFRSCYNLSNLSLGENVQTIGKEAFSFCRSVFEVVVSDNTTTIGADAFYSCTSLTLLTLGKNLEKLGDESFQRCYNLTVVEARGEEPAALGKDVWSSQQMLLIVPYGALEAYQNISGWNNFSHIETGKEMKAFYAIDGDIFYYTLADGQTIARATNTNCQTAEIKPMVTIGDKQCMVTSIPDQAFYSCENLRHVVIPNNVVSIGAQAFAFCTSLSTIDIGENVESIGVRAFDFCYNLQSISLPDKITDIPEYAFCCCRALHYLKLGNNMKSIASSAFNFCPGLRFVEIAAPEPPSVDKLAFEPACFKYSILSVPEGSVEAYQKADGWNNFNAIEGPCNYDDLHTIVDDVFYFAFSPTEALAQGCSRMVETIDLPQEIDINGKAYPLTTLPPGAFYFCKSLTKAIIPEGITKISLGCFFNCISLKYVDLPASITEVEGWAFYANLGLSTMICRNPTPPSLGEDALEGYSNATLYVPGASVDIYKDTSVSSWRHYIRSIRSIESSIGEVKDAATLLAIEPGGIKAIADQVAVAVYSLDGRLEAKALLNVGDTLPLAAGLHIVTVNGQPQKIAIP